MGCMFYFLNSHWIKLKDDNMQRNKWIKNTGKLNCQLSCLPLFLIGSKFSKETEQNSFMWGVCIYAYMVVFTVMSDFESLALDLTNYPRQFCTVDGVGFHLWIHFFFWSLCNSWTSFFYESIFNALRYSSICNTLELLYVKSAWLWKSQNF